MKKRTNNKRPLMQLMGRHPNLVGEVGTAAGRHMSGEAIPMMMLFGEPAIHAYSQAPRNNEREARRLLGESLTRDQYERFLRMDGKISSLPGMDGLLEEVSGHIKERGGNSLKRREIKSLD